MFKVAKSHPWHWDGGMGTGIQYARTLKSTANVARRARRATTPNAAAMTTSPCMYSKFSAGTVAPITRGMACMLLRVKNGCVLLSDMATAALA
jgi:hypothetical protein